jgi:hypothetical protein
MLNAGFPTYGPSKAAFEALSAIMAKDFDGTGVAVNVLVRGGVTDTPMISDEAGFYRAQLIQPEVMVPPLLWVLSDASRESDGSTVSRSPLGSRAIARTSGREGWGTGRLDRRCDNANQAETFLDAPALMSGQQRPPRRRARRHRTGM